VNALAPNPTADVNMVTALLCELGWLRDPDLTVNDKVTKPVFRRKWWKVVVGPLWTTYYRLVKEHIVDQDSIKTADYDAVEHKLRELSRG